MHYRIEDLMLQEFVKHLGFKFLLSDDPKVSTLEPIYELDLATIVVRSYDGELEPKYELQAAACTAKSVLNSAIVSSLINNPKNEQTQRVIYGCCGFMGLLEAEEVTDQIKRYYYSDQRIWDKILYHNGGLVWAVDRKLKIHLN